MEQLEYENEGIKWVHINFKDNQDKLDLIGMKPLNIMALIDEESKFPRGTDTTLLAKLNQQHAYSSIYIKPRSTKELQFGVRHYAGVVYYNTKGFLDKNRDTLTFDFSSLLAKSKNKFLLNISPVEMPLNALKKSRTLSTKFRSSLDALMQTLSASHPYFIRCIKPNEQKAPNQFDRELCVRQLRYAGMMETARIRRAGYPIRHTFKEFVERYKIIMAHIKSLQGSDYRQLTCEICNIMLPKHADYQCGRQKVFLKDREDAILERARKRIYLCSIKTLQRAVRRMIQRKKLRIQKEQEELRRQHEAAKNIQRSWRLHRQSKAALRQGVVRLAAAIDSRRLTCRFRLVRSATVFFQAHCRGYLARERYKAKKMHDFQNKLQNGTTKNVKHKHQQARFLNSDDETSSTLDVTPSELIEKSTSLVDDVFGFLNDASVTGPANTTVREKSLMFEREFLLKKNIPTKLLSRPVNYYEASPDATRL